MINPSKFKVKADFASTNEYDIVNIKNTQIILEIFCVFFLKTGSL